MVVTIGAFRPWVEAMCLPRAVITPFPLGRPLGPPHNARIQRNTIQAALTLLREAETCNSIKELPGAYRPGS